MKKTGTEKLFQILDKNGKVIPINDFFDGIEHIFSDNFRKYNKSLIPFSFYYCGTQYPFDSMMFIIGLLSGIVITKRGYRIKFKGKEDIKLPPALLKMICDMRKTLNESS